MENTLLVGSNTLSNAIALASGYVVNMTLMAIADGQVSTKMEFVPIRKDGTQAAALPAVVVTAKTETLDTELTEALYRVFQGDLAQKTHSLADYHRVLDTATEVASKRVDAKAATIQKPGATMPPPTGRKESTTTASSTGTGANAPAKPTKPTKPAAPQKPAAPGQEPAQVAEVVATVAAAAAAPASEPLVEDAVIETAAEEEDFDF